MPLSLRNVTLGPSALGQHYTTSGHNFSVLTSAPVNICIVSFGDRHYVGSARFLIIATQLQSNSQYPNFSYNT